MIAETHHWSERMDPQDSDELEQLSDLSRAESMAAFPPDPLGNGARWRATMTVSERGVTSSATVAATLVQHVGDRVTTQRTVEVHATAVPGGLGDTTAIPLPLARGQIKFRSMTLTGTGTTTEDLRSLVPISQVSDSVRVVVFDIGGAPWPISVTRTRHESVGPER